uniref:Uncharacterized protein n=1 Tax=Rhizophora mucronata TaxID=61149 RepID=A0A2P2J9W9_RHIMU
MRKQKLLLISTNFKKSPKPTLEFTMQCQLTTQRKKKSRKQGSSLPNKRNIRKLERE